MEPIGLPALEDNPLWMLHGGRQAIVVVRARSRCGQRTSPKDSNSLPL
jgi:hypothetical protein